MNEQAPAGVRQESHMEMVVLFFLGALVLASVIGSIWMLVTAARVSVLWFLAVFLIPGAILVFAILHWDVAKKPFLLSTAPGLAGIAAALLIPNLVARPKQAEEIALPIEEAAPAARATAPGLGSPEEFAQRFLRGDPSAGCPHDATLVGARPPKGFALWCQRGSVKHGPHATWHPNGQPATAGLYRDGLREGVWLRYSTKGDLQTTAAFQNDLQHGPMRDYDPLGRISRETHWAEGAPAN
jgi:hypothetical protein